MIKRLNNLKIEYLKYLKKREANQRSKKRYG